MLKAIFRREYNFSKTDNGDKTMKFDLNEHYTLISPKNIEEFIEDNKITIQLLNKIKTPLENNFPNSKISLEVCDHLEWTDDTKLLVNISVSEDMFFNGILENFNNIYKEIQPILDEYVSTIILFPEINGKDLKNVRMNSNSAINLLARTAYFNTYNGYEIQREITLRDIPKNQQKEEIISYCKIHNIIDSWQIAEKLRLETNEVEEILEELKKEKIITGFE